MFINRPKLVQADGPASGSLAVMRAPEAAAAVAPEQPMNRVPMMALINGQRRTITIEPCTTLLDAVEYDVVAVPRIEGDQIRTPTNGMWIIGKVIAELEYGIVRYGVEKVFAVDKFAQASSNNFEKVVDALKAAYSALDIASPAIAGRQHKSE